MEYYVAIKTNDALVPAARKTHFANIKVSEGPAEKDHIIYISFI